MLDLDSILSNICNNLHPVIQREDGLYTICHNLYPDETLGTNLRGDYNTNNSDVYFILSGEWSSGSFVYDDNTNKWHLEFF